MQTWCLDSLDLCPDDVFVIWWIFLRGHIFCNLYNHWYLTMPVIKTSSIATLSTFWAAWGQEKGFSGSNLLQDQHMYVSIQTSFNVFKSTLWFKIKDQMGIFAKYFAMAEEKTFLNLQKSADQTWCDQVGCPAAIFWQVPEINLWSIARNIWYALVKTCKAFSRNNLETTCERTTS